MKKRQELHKKLTRSADNRVIAGVLGGLAEYLNIKPNTLRLVYLVATALTSFVPGIIIYCMLVVLMPDSPKKASPWQDMMHSMKNSHDRRHERKELHDVEEKDL